MIDEYWTFVFYGYHSDELSYGSGKPIVSVCDECYKYRVSSMDGYCNLCLQCKLRSPETRHKMSDAKTGKPGAQRTPEWRHNLSEASKKQLPFTEERCQRMSAQAQGIPYDEWTGFSESHSYCSKFNESLREHIREKYGHRCFICNLAQEENMYKSGKHVKLCVHHVDMNKEQGCDGHDWNLVPLCVHCHGKAHHQPINARIEYLLEFVWL